MYAVNVDRNLTEYHRIIRISHRNRNKMLRRKKEKVMEKYGTLAFLLFSSFLDIRKREISIPVTLLFGLAGVVYSIRTGRNIVDYLIPLGIGTFILAGSVLTRGQVGMGDGWMLLALGCMLRMESYIQMACTGMLLAAVCSGVLMLVFRKNRKTEIPLVPFLLLGYVGGMVI